MISNLPPSRSREMCPPEYAHRVYFASTGQSSESRHIDQVCKGLLEDYYEPVTRRDYTTAIRFAMLLESWQEDTAFFSDMERICLHPAYQQVIGMGLDALPFIFEHLKETPELWFWALKAITGENPVPPEDKGRVSAMANHWLRWAVDNGYIRRS